MSDLWFARTKILYLNETYLKMCNLMYINLLKNTNINKQKKKCRLHVGSCVSEALQPMKLMAPTTEEVVQHRNWKLVICSHREIKLFNISLNDKPVRPEGPKQHKIYSKRHLGPSWIVPGHLFSDSIHSDKDMSNCR